jgi:hypothetical protein
VQSYHCFVSQSSELCCHNTLCCFSRSVYCCKGIFRYRIRSEGINPRILNLGPKWKSTFTARMLHLRYPLDGKLGGPRSWSERDGEEENIPWIPLEWKQVSMWHLNHRAMIICFKTGKLRKPFFEITIWLSLQLSCRRCQRKVTLKLTRSDSRFMLNMKSTHTVDNHKRT